MTRKTSIAFAMLYPLILSQTDLVFAQPPIEVKITCKQNATTPFTNRVDIKATASVGNRPGSQVAQGTIGFKKGNAAAIPVINLADPDRFQVEPDTKGEFTLVFNFSGNSFPGGENQLQLEIDGNGGIIGAQIGQLAAQAPLHNMTLVLNLTGLAGSRALAGRGLNQAFSIGSSSSRSSFLLTEQTGTAVFPLRRPGLPMQLRVQSLELSGGSDDYVFYRESDSDSRWWAFAKSPTVVCKCVNGRWILVSGHRVYYWNRRVSKKWNYFGMANARNPVRERISEPAAIPQ